ncbi:MAG: penicillin-binding protein 2 [Solirubrobacterales bacterium]
MYLLEDDKEERRSRSPMALRVTILGGLAVAMFSIVFLRLWYLQVLSGDHYLNRADDNRIRDIREQGPRGDILDRDGNVLVANRLGMALQADLSELPAAPAQRRKEIAGVAEVAGLEVREVRRTLAGAIATDPRGKVILTKTLSRDQIYYLREHQIDYPGIAVQRVFTRTYKDGALAAHLFGSTGEVSKEQLAEPRYSGLQQGDVVGQSGIEYEYDRFLRGRAGTSRIPVDALGRPTGAPDLHPATPGDNVRLTIDPSLQATGEAALGSIGLPGAFVAMDVHTGEVLGMASRPAFDPAIFTKPITPAQYKALTSEQQGAPLVNRAIEGAYPTGSVFKPITAIASLQGGLLTPQTTVFDGGTLKIDNNQTLHNARDAVYGTLDMANALRVSSDIFFFKLGLRAPAEGNGGLIQDWAHNLGLGEKTGIDLPNEARGLIPTPAWRNDLYKKGETDRPWSAGDNVNLSVGQGDLQADPLQMAVVYSTIANGGDVVRPHLVERVEDVSGRVLQEVRPEVSRHVDIKEANRITVIKGLTAAAMSQGGTSYPIFGNFPVPIAGKTGTAERAPHADQAWYVALAPADDPRIVVAVTLEEGGFGADTAAPVAAQILADYLNIKAVPGPPSSAGGPQVAE